MKKYIKLFEEFGSENLENQPQGESTESTEDEYEAPNQHVQFLQQLINASAEEIRQHFLEGSINTQSKRRIAASRLGALVAAGKADPESQELFHQLNDSQLD